MGKDLDKTYDPHSFEDRLYAFWQEKGYFSPVVDHDKKPYSIMMPPPNITGQLHLGHALDNTLPGYLSSGSSGCRAIAPCGCPAPTMLPSLPRRRS